MSLPSFVRVPATRLQTAPPPAGAAGSPEPPDMRADLMLNVAEEVPVSLVFNELHPYAVMMATPADLADFARGFTLTERIVSTPEGFLGCEIREIEGGIACHLRIAGADFSRLLQKGRRAMTGRTGCGLCGIDRLEALEQPLPRLAGGGALSLAALRRALAAMADHQNLNARTRMVHAAAWADPAGDIVLLREDVGRHNALDKLIGARLGTGEKFDDGFCILTSRYSFEMAEKTVIAGIRVVAAISAPTARALRVAEDSGQTLVAIARPDAQMLFCGADRVINDTDAAP